MAVHTSTSVTSFSGPDIANKSKASGATRPEADIDAKKSPTHAASRQSLAAHCIRNGGHGTAAPCPRRTDSGSDIRSPCAPRPSSFCFLVHLCASSPQALVQQRRLLCLSQVRSEAPRWPTCQWSASSKRLLIQRVLNHVALGAVCGEEPPRYAQSNR